MEDTVTWGKPDSSLKVSLKFEHQGSEYLITRGKSGAELQGPGFLSSGAAEVTAKVEELFGARQDIARAVMISNQDDIRRGLGDGNMDLIESLSDTGLIDVLVKRIQEKLPTGNTSILDNEIAKLYGSPRPVLNIEAMLAEIASAEAASAEAASRYDAEVLQLEPLKARATLAEDLLRRYENSAALQAKNSAEISALQNKRYDVPAWAGPSEEDLERLQTEKQRLASLAAVKKRFDAALVQISESVRKLCSTTSASELAEKKTQLEELVFRERHLQSHLSVEGVCNVCGSILEDQEALQARKESARVELAILTPEILSLRGSVREIEFLLQAHAVAVQTIRDAVAGLDAGSHASVEWDGEVPTLAWLSGEVRVPTEDYEKQLKNLRATQSAIAKAEVEKLRDTSRLASLLSGTSETFDADTLERAKETLLLFKDKSAAVQVLKRESAALIASVATKKQALELRRQAHSMEVQGWEKDQARMQELQKQLAETLAHNALIKKLRDARPIVVNKLWSLLLHLISESFSDIRGIPSVVTRGDKGFAIDGKSYRLYSGSTIDSLGLAAREAMQKVFLGTVDFTMVDEAAKGMDATRHTNMLAQLSRSGFKQVLVITHSDLVDVYATNLIQL